MSSLWRRVLSAHTSVAGSPEFNLAVFALLLNFPWEILQAPLFMGMADAAHAEVIRGCTQATLGDLVITLIAHGAMVLGTGHRRWVIAPTTLQLALFISVGVVITAVIERLATNGHWVQTWTYAPAMPVLPGLGIGVLPLLQWTLLPPLTVWFARRQLAGHAASA
jgi:hypothetical protein